MRKIMNINDFNAEEFIAETQRKYGQAVTWNVIRGLTRMLRVAENSDYLEELNSPRCIVRMAVQPLTGNIIIKTINDSFNGYRYLVTPDKVEREKVNYKK